jgi:penicillin-insensitive murein endopeptidase
LGNHDGHVHLRILCPKNSPKCIPQEAPPEGDGCDSISSR